MNRLLVISHMVLAVEPMAAVVENAPVPSIDWLSWSGWIIGAIGLVITIIQIRQSKKEKKSREREREAEKFLFKIAEQHIDKNIKTEEIESLDKKLNDMKEAIQEEIPKEAQRIALKNIIDNETQTISESYTKLVAMKEKLHELTGEGDIGDDGLINSVYKEISPTYSQHRNQQTFSNIFIIISVLSSLISVLIPYEYSRYVLFVVMAIQLALAILQIKVYINNNYSKKDRYNLTCFCLPLAACILALFSTLILMQMLLGRGSKDISDVLGSFIAIAVFGVSAYILSGIYFIKIRKNPLLIIMWCTILLLTILASVLMVLVIRYEVVIWELVMLPICLTGDTIFLLVVAISEYSRYRKSIHQ